MPKFQREWATDSLQLDKAGTVSGDESCHITWGDFQLYAEIKGNSQFEVPIPQIITPPQLPVVSDTELVTSEDELVKIHQSKLPHANNITWKMPLILATSSLLLPCYCTTVYTHT
jgi:hypothetical protein